MGHSVHRLRDFNDYEMENSPYNGRRPSSHTAYVAETASPSHMTRHQYEPHLPNFHHDHLHHAGQEVLGVSTLQPNSQRRERAREALLRRNCDLNLSVDSGQSNAESGSSRTTENPTETTVVHRHGVTDQHGGHLTNSRLTLNKVHVSTHSLHSTHSHHSHHSNIKCEPEEDPNSDDHLSSEDNLSHESYDLLDKEEEAAQHSYSDNIKTVLTYDNSYSYSMQQPIKMSGHNNDNIEPCHSYREDLINSNLNCHSKPNSHSSTYSSRQSMNSSGMSASPLPEGLMACEPQSVMARRRSSGTLSQRSKSSRDTSKSDPKSEQRALESRISLREGHFLSEDNTDDFHGHEVHMSRKSPSHSIKSSHSHSQQQQHGLVAADTGMHENLIFQSPTNIQYFSPQIQPQPQFSSRTLPNRKRREKSPVIFTTGKLSVDCSSASSSSQASPRMCRPKSLDFSVVALHDLPQSHAYSYRDDTIEQQDFEENSSSTVSVQNNYASSSDVPQTPEVPIVGSASHPHRSLNSGKPIQSYHQQQAGGSSSVVAAKLANSPFSGQHNSASERIYDIPEGIEMDDQAPKISSSAANQTRSTVFQNIKLDPKSYKSYLEITRKFSSEESESISHKHKLKILPPSHPKGLKKVSSTESESAISNHSHHSVPPVQFDSDTLSLPIDLISPPLESESSTALVDSESLPAPPQFGSNKDDTDIEDEVTPRGDEGTNTLVRRGSSGANKSTPVVVTANVMEQPEKSKFCYRVAPPVVQNIELIPPPRQDSTYETRAERLLESQLTRVDTFNDGQEAVSRQNNILDILDLDQEAGNPGHDSLLLKALDSFDSFNNDSLKISSGEGSLTYEENAECALEKQTTIDSFTSQLSTDNNEVFFEPSIENKVQELSDPNFANRRDQILESQSTFESFTTECEVIVTKRQESTYEERAETMLESQNTIESFTTETVQTEDVFDMEPPISESSLLNDDCQTQIEKADLVADMYVSKMDPGVAFMEDGFDAELVSSGGKLVCGQGDKIMFNNFVELVGAEQSTQTDASKDVVSGDSADGDTTPTGPYDTEPAAPLPPDEFGNYTVPNEPLFYRDGFRGSFPMRTLSRISEKSSNDSGSTPSEDANDYDEVEEHNYTTSEDNENAPSISSDLPENMAAASGDDGAINPINDLHVEYGGGMESNPSSQEESPKNTECTQLDQDTLDDDDEEDLDETNAEEIKTEERDLPPDFKPELTVSITSEADITNKDSDGSLHDSMEILEEVTTDACFEHDLNRASFEGSEQELESQRQIQWKVTLPKQSSKAAVKGEPGTSGKPGLLKKPSVSLSENSGKYVVTEGTEEIIL